MQIKIKVKTKAREEKVMKIGEDSFEVYVKALPEKGKANKAVVKALAKYLKVSRDNIKIIAGKATKQKILEMEN
ncbi:MAG: DUF167 domain-containing protein [Candidatus Pacebacteria bacterium]|nr:DUF167 domain-containing protein [Candidatus Paceibacterota bacterium]